jgi:ribosomal protein S10
MRPCNLIFISKNKNSVNSAFLFFLNLLSVNFKTVKKYFQKKTKKKFVSILKSPHVNKKAQEQFETLIYSKQLSIYSIKQLKHLLFLKKIQNNLFSDVKLKIKFSINYNKEKKFNLNTLGPKNYLLKLCASKNILTQKKSLNNKKKLIDFNLLATKKILKILDTYGELNITS